MTNKTTSAGYHELSLLTRLPRDTLRKWETSRPEYMALFRDGQKLISLLDPKLMESLNATKTYPELAEMLGLPLAYFELLDLKRTTVYNWGKDPVRRFQLQLLLMGGAYRTLIELFDSSIESILEVIKDKYCFDALDIVFLHNHRPITLMKLLAQTDL
jgi:hypothetical protein